MSQSGRFVTAASLGAVTDLTGNTGGPVPPTGGNINVVGDTTTITVAGNPGTSTLTISTTGAIADSFATDSGTATPAAGVITMHGGNNISTSGAGSTVTYNVSGTTNHSLQLGNASASLSSLGVATNGQLPIGSAGADPVLATITAGTGVTVTNGAGSITIAASGSVPLTFAADSGSATPSAGTITMHGGNNISTSAAGSTVTYNVAGTTNHSIQLGNASGSLTSLGVATNGQIPIGSSGADPVLATITAGSNITVTNGAGSITIAANSGAVTYNYTSVNHAASPYTVLSTDYYIGADVTAGVISILLPNAPTTGRAFVVKDKAGLAATSNITVTTVGGAVNIDGATSFVMNTAYEAISLIFNGASYEIY